MPARLKVFGFFVCFFCFFQVHADLGSKEVATQKLKLQVNDFVFLLEKESSYSINRIFDDSEKLVLNLKRSSSHKGKIKITAKGDGQFFVIYTEPSQFSPLSVKYRVVKAEQLRVTEVFKDLSSMGNSQNLYQVLLKKGVFEKSFNSQKLGSLNYLVLDLNDAGKLYFIPHHRAESIHKNFSKSKLALQRDYMIHLSKTKIDFKQMAESYILAMKKSDYLHCESCE